MLAGGGAGGVVDQQAGGGALALRRLGQIVALVPRLRELGIERLADQFRGLAFGDRRQAGAVFALVIVAALVIDAQKTVEQHHLTGRAQADLAIGAFDFGCRALHPGGFHLAGDGALPDQVIQLALVIGADLQSVRRQHHVGRADAFMGFLRVLGLVLVHARRFRQVFFAELGLDRVSGSHHRLGGHVDPVGPHIGDQTGLVETLRRGHAGPRAHAQLAAGLLLQRRGHEGRPGIAAGGLGGDAGDTQIAAGDRADGHRGPFGVGQVESVQLRAGQRHELRVVFLSPRRRKTGMDGPVFARLECLYLHLAIDNQAQADGLDATRRFRAGQLAPQHGRQVEADQIIQRAAGQIGIDQRLVDLARLLHRLGHRGLGDGVEGHAIDRAAFFQCRLQRLQQVPTDRLAFAVGVGSKDESLVVLQRVADRLEVLLAVAGDFPLHREFTVGIDAAVLGRQVADVAKAGQHAIVAAEVFLDGLGLGRGFDDDNGHSDLGGVCNGAATWLCAEAVSTPVASAASPRGLDEGGWPAAFAAWSRTRRTTCQGDVARGDDQLSASLPPASRVRRPCSSSDRIAAQAAAAGTPRSRIRSFSSVGLGVRRDRIRDSRLTGPP